LNAMIGIIVYEKRFWAGMICQHKIYVYSKLYGEEGCSFFNYNKNLKLFDTKSLF